MRGTKIKRFRQMIKHLAKHNHLPDYEVTFSAKDDMVVFGNRNGCSDRPKYNPPPLKPGTFEKAKAIAPGCDVYFIEQEWRDWIAEPPRNPDAAFLGFCRRWRHV